LQGKRERDDIAQNGLLPDKGLSIMILLETSRLQLHMLQENGIALCLFHFSAMHKTFANHLFISPSEELYISLTVLFLATRSTKLGGWFTAVVGN
jgi:hypothetical protein